MSIKEINDEKTKIIDAETFRLEQTVGAEDGDKLKIYFGKFINDETVSVLTEVTLPFGMSVALAESTVTACAEYQYRTHNNIGLPDEFCEKVMKDREMLEKNEGDML